MPVRCPVQVLFRKLETFSSKLFLSPNYFVSKLFCLQIIFVSKLFCLQIIFVSKLFCLQNISKSLRVKSVIKLKNQVRCPIFFRKGFGFPGLRSHRARKRQSLNLKPSRPRISKKPNGVNVRTWKI